MCPPFDEKTGLWNSSQFVAMLNSEIDRARVVNRSLALVVADVDGLDEITRSLGKTASDKLLVSVSDSIRAGCRSYDLSAVKANGRFFLLLPETGWLEALAAAEQVRERVAGLCVTVKANAKPVCPTLSVGVSYFPRDADSALGLMDDAELALKQAQLRGCNRVSYTFGGGYGAADAARTTDLAAAGVQSERRTAEVGALRSLIKSDKIEGRPSRAYRTRWPWPCSWLSGAGVAVTMGAFRFGPQPNWLIAGLVGVLAALTQMPQVKNIYQGSSVSVSVAVNFAAALLGGVPAVVVASAVIALTHWLLRRPAAYKTLYNWATHLLAGSLPALVFLALAIPVHTGNLLNLMAPVILCALTYFLVDTGLIAVAIGLSSGQSVIQVWRERCQWLAVHYILLCLLGLCLAVAYTGLGPAGLFVFTVPVFMMSYAQKQYVEKAEQSVKAIERMNSELAMAHRTSAAATATARRFSEDLLLALTKLIDAREVSMDGHSLRVAEYCVALAEELGLPSSRVETIRQAAYLHDIGKIGVPDGILGKTAELTEDEYELVKKHVIFGVELLETCPGLSNLVPIIRHHHERWDGRGYPDKVSTERMSVDARILGMSDAVEAMSSDRPYRPAMTTDQIIAEIRLLSGRQFDPHLSEMMIRILGRRRDRELAEKAKELALQAGAGAEGDQEQAETPSGFVWTPQSAPTA